MNGIQSEYATSKEPWFASPRISLVSSFASRLPATLGEEVGVANQPDRALSNEHQPPTTAPLL